MVPTLKPNNNFKHIYAIIRYKEDAGEEAPIELRITVKKVVVAGRLMGGGTALAQGGVSQPG